MHIKSGGQLLKVKKDECHKFNAIRMALLFIIMIADTDSAIKSYRVCLFYYNTKIINRKIKKIIRLQEKV